MNEEVIEKEPFHFVLCFICRNFAFLNKGGVI